MKNELESEMLNIVCFKWGNKFSAEYVNKLYNAVERHITVPHSFTCFTDDPTGVICRTEPFLHSLSSWWYIIGLFNEKHNFKGKVLYMDLDTVIQDNIDHIISLDVDFAITEDFYRPRGLQTTFIMWKPEKYYHLYETLKRELPANPRPGHIGGTNGFIETYVPKEEVTILQDVFPKEFISYKVHIRDVNHRRLNDLPGDLNTAKVVCFHGRPMPHETRELPWMKKHWI